MAPPPITTLAPAAPPALPAPRGPVSAYVLDLLRGGGGTRPQLVDDPVWGDDAALALHILYGLHYRGFAGVDDCWEWDPAVLAVRAELEAAFEERLTEIAGPVPGASEVDAVAELRALTKSGGPSLSSHVELHGTIEQVREFVIHRSVYQLKEADPHTWGIPRLTGRSKAALVEIQFDEYGHGAPGEDHASLFRATMRHLGLDDAYGAHIDLVPGTTLATDNLVSLFGLHRRWRGALVGHLAHFEMCSVVPMGRYAAALRRLGLPEEATRFFDVHVVADAEHQVVAIEGLAGPFVDSEPDLAGDVVFGARSLQALEAEFAGSLLQAWVAAQSSLRGPLPTDQRVARPTKPMRRAR